MVSKILKIVFTTDLTVDNKFIGNYIVGEPCVVELCVREYCTGKQRVGKLAKIALVDGRSNISFIRNEFKEIGKGQKAT